MPHTERGVSIVPVLSATRSSQSGVPVRRNWNGASRGTTMPP